MAPAKTAAFALSVVGDVLDPLPRENPALKPNKSGRVENAIPNVHAAAREAPTTTERGLHNVVMLNRAFCAGADGNDVASDPLDPRP